MASRACPIDLKDDAVEPATLVARLEAVEGVTQATVVDEVDSTNRRVAEAAATASGDGVVVVASRQSAGRGRRGRRWVDVADGNIAMSLGVALPRQSPGLVPLAAALALRDVFGEVGARTSLKWPNDVRLLADGRWRKAAGILVETHPGSGNPIAIIGVGVNVDWRGRHPTDDPAHDWTSLAEAVGSDVDRADLVVALTRSLVAWHGRVRTRPHEVVQAYRRACDTGGAPVAVQLGVATTGVTGDMATGPRDAANADAVAPDAATGGAVAPGANAPGADAARPPTDGAPRRLVGTASRIDDLGRLVVIVDGREVTVAAGDVVHLRESP